MAPKTLSVRKPSFPGEARAQLTFSSDVTKELLSDARSGETQASLDSLKKVLNFLAKDDESYTLVNPVLLLHLSVNKIPVNGSGGRFPDVIEQHAILSLIYLGMNAAGVDRLPASCATPANRTLLLRAMPSVMAWAMYLLDRCKAYPELTYSGPAGQSPSWQGAITAVLNSLTLLNDQEFITRESVQLALALWRAEAYSTHIRAALAQLVTRGSTGDSRHAMIQWLRLTQSTEDLHSPGLALATRLAAVERMIFPMSKDILRTAIRHMRNVEEPKTPVDIKCTVDHLHVLCLVFGAACLDGPFPEIHLPAARAVMRTYNSFADIPTERSPPALRPLIARGIQCSVAFLSQLFVDDPAEETLCLAIKEDMLAALVHSKPWMLKDEAPELLEFDYRPVEQRLDFVWKDIIMGHIWILNVFHHTISVFDEFFLGSSNRVKEDDIDQDILWGVDDWRQIYDDVQKQFGKHITRRCMHSGVSLPRS
jgi:hypothetical protein